MVKRLLWLAVSQVTDDVIQTSPRIGLDLFKCILFTGLKPQDNYRLGV